MAEVFAECCSAICAVCCICCTESLQQWCLFKKFGSGDGSAGCCTSCCKQSFDDDDFDKEEARLQAQRAARDVAEAQAGSSNGVVSIQPSGENRMIAPAGGEGPPAHESSAEQGI